MRTALSLDIVATNSLKIVPHLNLQAIFRNYILRTVGGRTYMISTCIAYQTDFFVTLMRSKAAPLPFIITHPPVG